MPAPSTADLGALGELFAPSTSFGEHGMGAAGARAFYRTVLQGFYRSFHQIVGQVITDLDTTSARGTVYCRAEHEDGDNWVVNLMIYFDRYVRVDGRWCFLGRRPRFPFVGDVREARRAIDFNRWPRREDRFNVELPQSDATTTLAPSRDNSTAMPPPIPRPAPVTIATFPSSARFIRFSVFSSGNGANFRQTGAVQCPRERGAARVNRA